MRHRGLEHEQDRFLHYLLHLLRPDRSVARDMRPCLRAQGHLPTVAHIRADHG
jgi:hypothetical protein